MIDKTGASRKISCLTTEGEAWIVKSCWITWKNENYIMGGQWNNHNGIMKLSGQTIKRVGTLDFDHNWGSCNNIKDEKIFLARLHLFFKSCKNLYETVQSATIIITRKTRKSAAWELLDRWGLFQKFKSLNSIIGESGKPTPILTCLLLAVCSIKELKATKRQRFTMLKRKLGPLCPIILLQELLLISQLTEFSYIFNHKNVISS